MNKIFNREVTFEEFQDIVKDSSLIEYAMKINYLNEQGTDFYSGCVLKIRDKFHYLYFNSSLKYFIYLFIDTIINTFKPLELVGDVIEYFKIENTQLKVLLLEIRDDYLVIHIGNRIFTIYSDEYLFDTILEQYNLNLINGYEN